MQPQTKRLTKRERRLMRQENPEGSSVRVNLNIKDVQPLTENQARTFDAYEAGKNLMLHGSAGTGKSFLALYLALSDLLAGDTDYERLVIVRSTVSSRDMGFLPGTAAEKALVYEAPYHRICTELFNRGDSYEILKTKNIVEFEPTSFLRGTTYDDCIIVVDEMQNMTFTELDTVVTRVGKNCRIIFAGDFKQSDLTRNQERNGLHQFMQVIQKMKAFSFIEFTTEDIVRSGLVKSYIETKEALHIEA